MNDNAGATSTFAVSTSFLASGGAATGPFLFPVNFSTAPAVQTLNVPFVAGPNAKPGGSGCTVAASGDNTDFALTGWLAGFQGVVNAIVTVQPTNLFSLTTRAKLWASFTAFRLQLAPLEASGCLIPGGAALLAARVAQALPLTYAETLAFTYGLQPALRCADLRPGLTLRIDYGDYAYVGPATVPGAGGARNAYGGGGSARLRIRRRADGTLGFDALLDAFASYQIATPDQYGQVASLLDIEAAGNTLAYGRLIYPPQVDGPTFVASAPNPANNAALLFASSAADLETATQNFVQGGSNGGVGTALLFSGRAALSLEIGVLVNRVPTAVPLGTTLRDLVDGAFAVSILEIAPSNTTSNLGLKIWRWAQPSLLSGNAPINAYSNSQVTFETTTRIVPGSNASQWDLPLGAGDVVQWSVPQS